MLSRRALLIGAGAAGATAALLPAGVDPYPVPAELVPEAMRARVLENGGLYMVHLRIERGAYVKLGVHGEDLEGFTAYEYETDRPDDGHEFEAMIAAMPGSVVTATAFGELRHGEGLPRVDFRIMPAPDGVCLAS